MPTPLRRLAAHWPLKLASLGLAVLLWVLVSAEQVTTQWISLPLEAHVRDPRLVLTGESPHSVRVQVTGPGRLLWQLALSPPTLVLPIRDARESGYSLEPEMVRLPHGLRGVAIREIHPSVVRLDVQRVATREVPVRARFSRATLAAFLVRGEPEISPATVRVTGPAQDLARLRFVETLPIDVASEDSASFTARVALDTAGLGAFTIGPGTVRVAGTVDLHGRRTLDRVEIRSFDGMATGWVALRLDGPARVLAGLNPARVGVQESDSGDLRIVGLPASVQAEVTRRHDLPEPPPADSAGGRP